MQWQHGLQLWPIKIISSSSFSIYLRVSILLWTNTPERVSIRAPAGYSSSYGYTLILLPASQVKGVLRGSYWQLTPPR